MRLLDELKKATQLLASFPGQWAICGGVAASIYRKKPRFTDDIDFILTDTAQITAKDLALQIIAKLGYREYLGFVPDLVDNSKQILGLVAARTPGDERFIGLDFLLPVQFWIESAVNNAQLNMIDYGFAHLPTITPESLILGKLAAATSNPERFQDIDDIREIINSVPLNSEYIIQQVEQHSLKLSEELQRLVFTTK